MMRAFSLAELAHRCGTTVPAPAVTFTSVTTDSRKLKRGDLFVALRGDNFDGHDFLPQIAQHGACGAVVEKADTQVQLPQLVVDNTVIALGQLGALNREQFRGSVVGITGSSGKTTVKEMVAAILKQRGQVLVTQGNLNNHIGVPLMLLQIAPQHHYAVIEMGASAVGEIAYLASLAQPVVSVITNVGTAHVGGFGSVERIAEGKSEIYRALPAHGTAIINRDDPCSESWWQMNASRKIKTFSAQSSADVMAKQIAHDSRGRYGFELTLAEGASVHIQLSLLGQHNVLNALAAASCALALGVTMDHIQSGLESVRPVAGRMQVKSGQHGATIIDDTYNANPSSVRAAIDLLKTLTGKRILVLGDMAELGDASIALHSEIGRYAKAQQLDTLLAVGNDSRHAVEAFGAGAEYFADKLSLMARCRSLLTCEARLLVKGSRSAAMEDVVQALLSEETHPC